MSATDKIHRRKVEQQTAFENKLTLLTFLSNLAEKESDRLWTRNTTFFSLNTALLAIVGIVPQEIRHEAAGFFALLGLSTSIAWWHVNPLSFFYR